jgi:hypothetical protein
LMTSLSFQLSRNRLGLTRLWQATPPRVRSASCDQAEWALSTDTR